MMLFQHGFSLSLSLSLSSSIDPFLYLIQFFRLPKQKESFLKEKKLVATDEEEANVELCPSPVHSGDIQSVSGESSCFIERAVLDEATEDKRLLIH
jgi:hypothetical protein